jgi:hypothetical protein
MALSLRNLSFRKLPPKAIAVIAVVLISPVVVAGLAAAGKDSSGKGTGAPAAAPAVQAPQSGAQTDQQAETLAAAALGQCKSARLVPVGKDGWGVPAPSATSTGSTNCNLMYGDSPHRGSARSGDPDLAIKTLQRNLNYCYGTKLAVDGLYGSNTRAVMKTVQRKYKLPADGIYGPKTRSAMNWRLFKDSTRQWSTGCYSSL